MTARRRMPRWLARLPIRVFRAGLGWVFGGALVMVEHRGRTSGLPRHVVLEVLRSDGESVVVASGYGRAAQWFRNIEADPRVRLWRGWTTGQRAIAEVLSPEEGAALLTRYREDRPLRSRAVMSALDIDDLGAPHITPEVAERLPLVRLTPVPR